MNLTTRLIARCSLADRQLLAQVAVALRRTPSDTLRFLIHEKAAALQLPTNQPEEEEMPLDSQDDANHAS
ncbi:MAG: hypothetical protein KJ069_18480 [Anaerolineae bacterium]|nr:hypothetical protein [Anaerolineae bacterium]